MAEEINEELLEEDSQKGKFMTFKTGKEYFGISISYVNEIIVMQPITAIPEVEDYIKGLINLRGKIIPVIDVRLRFRQEPIEYTDRTCIIVIDVKNVVVGLIVQTIAEVVGHQDDAVGFAPVYPRPGLVKRGGVVDEAHIGRGIDEAQVLPAGGCAALVNDDGRHLADGFVVVNKGVDKRVQQRYDQEKDEHTLIGHGQMELVDHEVHEAPPERRRHVGLIAFVGHCGKKAKGCRERRA